MRPILPIAIALSLGMATSGNGQTFPTPGSATPRVQSVQWTADQTIVLTALPGTTLTTMLEPRETIQRVTLGGSRAWDVSVSAEANSFQVTPQEGAAPASLIVETDQRRYNFTLETGRGLMAAYLVRLEYDSTEQRSAQKSFETITDLTWGYRLRGDREVRPLSVRDNGEKTVITYAVGQALPAVFAVGPTGDEEVVDGYMRNGLFVIDRVHQELVFRIDRERATARRHREEDEAQ